jgi:hypothetical protein
VEHRLGGRQDDDGIRLDKSGTDAKRNATVLAELDEVGTFGVVDVHPPGKTPGELGKNEVLELLLTCAAGKASGDEDGLTLERHSDTLELGDDRGKRLLPRVSQSGRDRQGRGLDDDRDAGSRRHQLLQGRPREGKAERLLDGGSDVRQGLGRRRRTEHRRVVGQLDDLQSRAGEKRNLHPV